ncbi:hypothetical protein CTAYLR_001198 [Chrysophaeum taylorii]|uniref:N-acetylglucosaminylphosphatidylinositol deacetylase n=1 Tax=Chrysophaeum taylorii TaxID=2483200 RepID=A0AAD7UCE3_9STRA|nr:hypothetical protein CTAYLR_001198 [Chrysophaeum taylorii]
MFFLPSLMMMREREVHILSLSNGGAVGLGATRAEEMECAARWHGAKARIIDDPRLADGATWDEKVVAERVRAYLDEVGEAIGVVTFDWRGASGHSNHVATFASDTDVVTYNIDALAGWRAMTWHASQFVWYRKAFVVLSAVRTRPYHYCG